MGKVDMNELKWQQAVKTLPLQMQPDKDLWPKIEGRLESRDTATESTSGKLNWRLPAIAAAVLVALTTGIFIGRGLELPAVEQLSVRDYVVAGSTQNAEREFQAAFQEMVALDYSGMQLAGDNPDALRGSWNEMQKAETSLLAALKDYPANRFLNTKLIELRSQQLQFVKQVVLLEQNNWRRT